MDIVMLEKINKINKILRILNKDFKYNSPVYRYLIIYYQH